VQSLISVLDFLFLRRASKELLINHRYGALIECLVQWERSSNCVGGMSLAVGAQYFIFALFPCCDSALISFALFDAVLDLQQEHEVGYALVNHLQSQSKQPRYNLFR
jgi:hypothetical protein